MTMMTNADRRAVAEASPQTLAEWWCLLNEWGWPAAGLGEPDPIPDKRSPFCRRSELMAAIEAQVGQEGCLREWARTRHPGEPPCP